MEDRKFVAYYRVSTTRQGKSGLGLEAQKHAVEVYLNGGSHQVMAEFTEVESGKKKDRNEINKAIDACRLYGATLIIAKLDRLSRNAAFLLTLKESGIDICVADMPEADSLTIGVMALIAEREAAMISERTKAALQAAKRRGIKLGCPNGASALRRAGKGNHAAVAARRAKSLERAERLKPVILELRGQGVRTYRGLANALNDKKIPSPTGGKWYPASVRRIDLYKPKIPSTA